MDGLRYNNGKTRHDLTPPFAQEQYAKVFTKGSEKYEDRNWEKGMSWSKVIASAKRHLLAFESGEDYDKETGLLHTAHLMANAAFMTEYYKICPWGDDRPHNYLNMPKIGIDIDEVLADWVKHWTDYFNQPVPEVWKFDRFIKERFEELKHNKEFWLTIPVKTPPSDIPFEPHCYITSRHIPNEWTEEWLDINKFPAAPCFTTFDKPKVALEQGIKVFIDDNFNNFVDMNKAGICCYLFDAPHNRRYDVGYKRIKDLRLFV